MPSLAAIERVEDRIGLPVTSAAICTTRKMLTAAGLEPVAPDAGFFLSRRNLDEGVLASRQTQVA
jgi:maleate isomerase